MSSITEYRTFRIRVNPSVQTNDHEVRFYGDGENIIARFWSESIGLDPNDVLTEECQLRPDHGFHDALIARCNCGCLGCGDIVIQIQQAGELVVGALDPHLISKTQNLLIAGKTVLESTSCAFERVVKFPAKAYGQEIERAIADTSWETPDRTAARLVRLWHNRESLKKYGMHLQWASGRVRPKKFTISVGLEPGPFQILVCLPWEGESHEIAAKESVALLSKPPSEWPNVEWYPQKPGLDVPPISGAGWQRGG